MNWLMAETPASQREILVVDDDPAVREVLSALFTSEGFQVTNFADGASLLASARSRTPVCIILDVNIPGRSGLDILKELTAKTIRRRSSSCPARATFQWRSMRSKTARSISSRSPFAAAPSFRRCGRRWRRRHAGGGSEYGEDIFFSFSRAVNL